MSITKLSKALATAGVKHVVVAATPEIEAMERFEADPSVSALYDILIAQKINAGRIHKRKDGVRIIGNFIEATVKLSDSQSVHISIKARAGKKIAETTQRYLHGFGNVFTTLDAAWQWFV